ncbi:GGDEF domain-containing protein [Glaciecola sp. XM2]|uniref:GGDEF domain-containing protein n=1 Tax=Glaciecola sp. XM2 TaxID=1914931 RepID=UPI001BDE29D6|nr:GGDEF domain-containing protein [Glaciecola sp. XM2]
MSIAEIANINYLFIIFIMNLVGVAYFYVSPARRVAELTPSVNSFMTMFAVIAAAFAVFALRALIPIWISLTLANGLFLLSAYCAKRGFVYRSGHSPPQLLKDREVWVNISILTIVNTGIFYLWIDNFAIRATITSVYIAYVFYSSINKIPKNPQDKSDGEKIAQFAIYVTVFFTPLSATFHWFDQSYFVYMSTLMFTQAIAVTSLLGAFLSLLTSDLIEEHYHNSVIDPLTGVYNRRFFNDKASKLLGFSRKTDNSHGVIVTDIDDFKDINDKYGHAAGDEALVKFAKIISQTVRSSDVVARFGGEEFVILLPSSSQDETAMLAKRLCEEISNCVIATTAGDVSITASFGVSMVKEPNQLQASLEIADAAMYKAKGAGKNRVVIA